MRGLLTIGGVGLCLALTGCASTQQDVMLSPGPGGVTPGPRPWLVAHLLPQPHVHCDCGPVQLPGPPSLFPPGVPQAAAPPPATTLARFLPMMNEGDGMTVDPLENVRPDPLGVRTTTVASTVLNDARMVRTSTDERQSDLPLIVKINALPRVPSQAPHSSVEMIEPSAPTAEPAPASEATSVAAGAPPDASAMPPGTPQPRSEGAIPLEYADDPALAGRPRLASDGTIIPPPRAAGDPTRYGPDPTFPASYSNDSSALTTAPKTREVWPARRPSRPTLLSRLIERFRKPDESVPPAPSPGSGAGLAQGEPGDLPKYGQGIERVSVEGPYEPLQR